MTKNRMDQTGQNKAQNNRGGEDPKASSLSPKTNPDKKPAEQIKRESA